MGLLDDAIREHLDLKRRRGADPAEIERAEREALGPVKRAPEEPEEEIFGPEDGDPEALYEDRAVEGDNWLDPFEEEAAPDSPPRPDAPEAESPMVSFEERFQRPAEPPEHPGQETQEYNVEEDLDEPPAGHEGEQREDVLQETPEFLQDTPDHDQLWFEQRPPRDFDFDG